MSTCIHFYMYIRTFLYVDTYRERGREQKEKKRGRERDILDLYVESTSIVTCNYNMHV